MEKLTKSDINLDEWEYEFQQRDSHPILMADLWLRALYRNYGKEINLNVDKLDYLFTSSSKGYVRKADKKQILDKIRESIDKEKYIDYIFSKINELFVEFDIKCKEINEKSKKERIGNSEIVDLWKKFDKEWTKIIPWYYIPWYVTEENILTDKVKEMLVKYKAEIKKITDFNNALMVLIFPVKKAMFQEEQADFYELVKLASSIGSGFEKDEGFLNKIKNYLNNYSWTKTFGVVPIEPLKLDELIENVKESLDSRFLDEYGLKKNQQDENYKLARELLSIIGGDKELVSYLEQSRELAWILTWSVELSLRSVSYLLDFFKLIAEKMNVPYEKWVNLTSEEIVKILEGNLEISNNELNERDNYSMMMENGIVKMAIGKEGKEISDWVDSNVGKIDSNLSEFKGQPTSSGKAKGKVRIAILARESHVVQEGEILVCSMTSPDYLPAMKKSAAIVTDEGGLLSHAAIVSREFGKPCVVGTKIATKLLKTGDEIEVDGDKGIIKILRKNEI